MQLFKVEVGESKEYYNLYFIPFLAFCCMDCGHSGASFWILYLCCIAKVYSFCSVGNCILTTNVFNIKTSTAILICKLARNCLHLALAVTDGQVLIVTVLVPTLSI